MSVQTGVNDAGGTVVTGMVRLGLKVGVALAGCITSKVGLYVVVGLLTTGVKLAPVVGEGVAVAVEVSVWVAVFVAEDVWVKVGVAVVMSVIASGVDSAGTIKTRMVSFSADSCVGNCFRAN